MSNNISTLKFENAGTKILNGGITSFGQVFVQGDFKQNEFLNANINGVNTPVQVDVKTRYEDGSVKFAVLSIVRPDLSIGQNQDIILNVSSTPQNNFNTPLSLQSVLTNNSFNINITYNTGETVQINALTELNKAIANSTLSFWQLGPLTTEARVSVELPGSQRLLLDITAYNDGTFSIETMFNNDQAMQSVGGAANYTAVMSMNGLIVDRVSIVQNQYQNWKETYSSSVNNGGQSLGNQNEGWLNIKHELEYLVKTGATPSYNDNLEISNQLLSSYAEAINNPSFGDPLAVNGVTQYMPGTGGRSDIGIVTASNATWLISGSVYAAEYSLGQAETSGAVPWNFWDTANNTYLNTDNYPNLWIDGRGGTGIPGNSQSGGLTQQVSGSTGWDADTAHQPELSFIPYLLTGERSILDGVMSQAAFNVMATWSYVRGYGDNLVVNENQVRGAAWSLRQIDNAAWAAPDGSVEKAYFQKVSDDNWSWLVSKIPEWTMAQGEAYGWVPGVYGYAGVMAPWQQDYFASTTLAAASRGNEKAMEFLKWQENYLVGRFNAEQKGFLPHDGVAYNIVIANGNGPWFKTWAEIGQATIAAGQSNGTGWANSQGDYAQLGAATLAGIYQLTGNPQALSALNMLKNDGAPFLSDQFLGQGPQYAVVIQGPSVTPPPPPPVILDETITLIAPSLTLSIDMGNGKDTLNLANGSNSGEIKNVENIIGGSGTDNLTVFNGRSINLGAGNDTLTLGNTSPEIRVSNVETIIGSNGNDGVTLLNAGRMTIDLKEGVDSLRLADLTGNIITANNIENIQGSNKNDSIIVRQTTGVSSINGGFGTDSITLASAANTEVNVVLTSFESVLGGSGRDNITFTDSIQNMSINLGGGADSIKFNGLNNSVSLRSVDNVTGNSGMDLITLETGQSNFIIDLKDGIDTLRLADTGNNKGSILNTEFIWGGTLNDSITVSSDSITNPVFIDLGQGADRVTIGSSIVNPLYYLINIETIVGSAGDDRVNIMTAHNNANVQDMGAGRDVINLSNFDNSITIRNTEEVRGGSGNDIITLSGHTLSMPAISLYLGDGWGDAVNLASGGGAVNISGAERITGRSGADTIKLIGKADEININLGGGADLLTLDNFDNTIFLSHTRNVIGGSQDDRILAQTALSGANISLGIGFDELLLGNFSNSVTVQSIENIWGGSSTDRITVTGENSSWIRGGAGNDVIIGGFGRDTIEGGTGVDVMSGGFGADTFLFNRGDSTPLIRDSITDFSSAQGDKIGLLGEIFGSFDYRGIGNFIADGETQARFNTSNSQLQVDWNGDATVDLTVVMQNTFANQITSSSFIWGI